MGKIKLCVCQNTAANNSDPVVPLVPCTGIFLGPSKSGKTVALISLILEQYRGVFERIYIFSPSINVDDGWIPVKKCMEEDLGVNVEKDQAYWEDWDEPALRRIIQQQRKITETSKKLEMKKLYQVRIIPDDLADMPQLHKPNGAPDTLFIRGRHMQISTWVSSQKLKLINAAVRVNQQFLCCWRLRNQRKLDAVVEELSALLPKEQLYRLYEQATREPCVAPARCAPAFSDRSAVVASAPGSAAAAASSQRRMPGGAQQHVRVAALVHRAGDARVVHFVETLHGLVTRSHLTKLKMPGSERMFCVSSCLCPPARSVLPQRASLLLVHDVHPYCYRLLLVCT